MRFWYLILVCLITTSAVAQNRSHKRNRQQKCSSSEGRNAVLPVYNDIVYLNNGSVVYGIITEYNLEGSLKIVSADGVTLTFPSKSVRNVTKGNPNTVYQTPQKYYLPMNSKTLRRGYKGSFDIGYEFTVGNFDGRLFGVSTSHGFQFNPYIYLGGGLALNYYHDDFDEDSYGVIPVFINVRTNFTTSRISPYFDFKTGYSINEDGGFYANPSIGVRFGLGRKLGLNLSASYTYQEVFLGYYYSSSSYGNHYSNEDKGISSLGIKLGLDF